jgi:DNA-binding CsgD family transcriptional regulator
MRPFFLLSLFLFALVFTSLTQNAATGRWLTLFHQPFDGMHTATETLWDSLSGLPQQSIGQIINSLEREQSVNGNEAGQLKLALIKLRYCRQFSGVYENVSWRDLGQSALRLAAAVQDEYLLQSSCKQLGDIYQKHNRSDTALFYLLKSIALAESLGYKKEVLANDKIAASSALYQTQNYAQCVAYCRSGIDIEKTLTPIAVVSAYNNSGLGYAKLGRPDSAFYFFALAAGYAKRMNWGIWEGIASGNMGDALHQQSRDSDALPYWQKDYDSSMKYGEYRNAGLTLAYLSRLQFLAGNRKAQEQLFWAREINKDDPSALTRIYAIQGECYRRAGLHDSADWFWQQHYRINDSLNHVAAQTNFTTVQLKLAFESAAHQYELLQKQRQAEIIRRNYLLIALVSLLFIGLLLFNRQRLKTKLAKQQQAIIESENASAKEQLSIFTQTLLEKNRQIEKLAASLVQQTTSVNDELLQYTLLTDYDWNKFKELFERNYPQFFGRLKDKASGITASEMRLAALIKLNLDNKQMASMQGISVSSLRGNKTRLRQKLGLSAETDLDGLLKRL